MNTDIVIRVISVMFLLGVIFLAFYSLYRLMNTVAKLHIKLDELEKEAKDAKTTAEVVATFEKLKVISADCWHQSLYSKISVIKAILDTKYNIYKEMDEK